MERWGRKPLPAKRKAPSTQISTGPIRRSGTAPAGDGGTKPEGRTPKWQYTNRGARDAAAQFVADARELRKATVRIARKFPASYKYVTTGPLLQLASEVYMNALKETASTSTRT